MRLGSLQDLCEDIVTGVEGAVGCALVDLTTGLPLALSVRSSGLLDSNAMELLAASGVAHFNGGTSAAGDASFDDEVEEIQTTTDVAYVFMSRVPDGARQLLVVVTDRKTTNLGLGWMSMRQALVHIRTLNANAAEGEAPTHAPPANPAPDRSDDPAFAMRSRNRRSIWG